VKILRNRGKRIGNLLRNEIRYISGRQVPGIYALKPS